MTCCPTRLACDEAGQRSAEDRLENERIVSNSTPLQDGRFKTEFVVPEMHCAGCIGAIERGLAECDAVDDVRANLSTTTVSVVWDNQKGNPSNISRKLASLGFDSHLADQGEIDPAEENKGKGLLMALAVAGFASANIMLLSVSVWSGADRETAHLFHLVSGLIAVPAIAFSGQPFFRSALKALSNRRLNMDVPISLAIILALGMSVYEGMTGGDEAYFDAGVTLLFFLLIGRYLDHLMRERARDAVSRLATLAAKSGAQVLPDGSLEYLAVNEIKPGMALRVFAGERFPVDGTIAEGSAQVDCSHVTGESDPVTLGAGEPVSAGTLNITSTIDYTATADASSSFLAEMQRMIHEAENGRSSYVRIADRMAQIYAPAVHLLALITFIAWMIASGGDWHMSLYIAIAVLIITCPCALGLAVPVAHVVGANKLMTNGILMRDGSALERLAEIDRVVFDKTGTLTSGEPEVSQVLNLDASDVPLLNTLAAASTHPAARAIGAHFGDTAQCSLSNVHELAGSGIEAEYRDKTMRMGKPEWVREIAATDALDHADHSLAFAVSGSKPAFFELRETLRADAFDAARELSGMVATQEILSGDAKARVATIAQELGIETYLYRQTPKQKIDHITDLKNDNHKVLMVGDGINDAPAMTAGHASIVPASASDVGRHAADFVFTRGSLSAIPLAINVARKTATTVRQNFGLAIAYNCIAVPLAMAGYVTPLFAAIAMSASSIVVVANSLRIGIETRPTLERGPITGGIHKAAPQEVTA